MKNFSFKPLVIGGLVAAVAVPLIIHYMDGQRSDGRQNSSRVMQEQKTIISEPVAKEAKAVAKKRREEVYQLASKDISSIPEELSIIAGLTGDSSSYKDRMKAIKSLSRDLDDNSIDFLREFLTQHYDEESGMTPRGFNAVKNDVLDILLRQNELVDGLGEDLVEMFNDRTYGDIWRDYCVQYMAPYYEQALEAARSEGESDRGVALNEELETIRDAYTTAMEDRSNSCAGTALIGVESLANKCDKISIYDVQKSAADIAMDASGADYNRITGLRMSGKYELKAVVQSARLEAQIGESTPLRMAAVATLAEIGGEREISLLESLREESEDKNLIAFVDRALEKLNAEEK